MYTCMDCNHEVEMSVHGRCGQCQSPAIAPLDVTYATGSREPKHGEYLLRETERSSGIVNEINAFRTKMAMPSTN